MHDSRAPRLLTPALRRVAEVMPVVVVTGARQTGKSTLVRELLPERLPFFSLDDMDVRAQAVRAPDELVRREPRLVLDEVQRVPEVILAVKQAVDEDRRPGRFILTGSADLLLMRRVSESLAGRAGYLVLRPLTRGERLGEGRPGAWSELLACPAADWRDLLAERNARPEVWRDAVGVGGYPVPALELETPDARAIWFDGYVRTYLERDLRDLAAVENLVDFRRLMAAACLRIGGLLNQTELGRDVRVPQPTVHRWLNLLETSYQLVRLPAYAVNRTKRLIKSPKLFWSDTGLALHLAGGAEPEGAHLENLILADLLAWRDATPAHRPEIFYWRTSIGEEVDLVIEAGRKLIGIEIKATHRPRASHADYLRVFRGEYGDRVHGCLLLHAGDATEWMAPGILAAPWWTVL